MYLWMSLWENMVVVMAMLAIFYYTMQNQAFRKQDLIMSFCDEPRFKEFS